MEFWHALHALGKLGTCIPMPEITSDTVSGPKVIYALCAEKSASLEETQARALLPYFNVIEVQYNLCDPDGVTDLGTQILSPFDYHRKPDQVLTMDELEFINSQNKPFVANMKAELARDGSPISRFDESEWFLTPKTIADLVAHMRMCKKYLDSGLGIN